MTPSPKDNPDWALLLAGLPELWASVPTDDPAAEWECIGAHIRAAYGVGYTDALTRA